MPAHNSRILSTRDLWLLALLTLTWGFNWPVMKIGVAEIEPMTFRAVSMVLGLPLLFFVVRVRGLPIAVPREHWRELGLLALTNMVGFVVLSMYGVKFLSSGRAVILGYTMPIFTALIGFAFFGERASLRLWLGVAAALAGVALLLWREIGAITGSPAGTMFMLAGAAVWGLGTQFMRRRRQTTPVIVIAFWSLLIALVVCATLALLLERSSWTHLPDRSGWLAIGYNAVVVFGFSQVMWFRLATILPPVVSSLSVMFIPVIGVFSGMMILGERPTWQDYAALVSILMAIMAVLRPTRRD
jgi:drug/metabolite transporter (DMT)-like permease